MYNLFLALFFIALIGLIIGLIKPSLVLRFLKGDKTRKRVALMFGGGAFLFFILFAITAPPLEEKVTKPTQEQTEKTIETKEITETEKITTGYFISQDVRVGDVRWKLIDVKDRGNILKASESKHPIFAKNKTTIGKFIEITMEVENLSKEMKSVSNLKLVDNKGREFISASGVSEWIPEDKKLFLLSNLNPNMPQQFSDIYEIPADATSLRVRVGDLSFWGNYEALINLGI